MRWAASGAADELLDAAVAYVRTEVFFANHNLHHGLRALDSAASLVHPGTSVAAAAAYGSLHMRAAVVAARCGDAAACDHLGEAHAAARHVNEGICHGTAFGPSSVRVHEVAVAVEMGDGGAAVQQAAGWAPPLQLPAERRSHYYIDLARAQLWVGHRDKALPACRLRAASRRSMSASTRRCVRRWPRCSASGGPAPTPCARSPAG